MRHLYDSVTQHLARLDFEALWPGFHPAPFALYNDQTVWLADGETPWNEAYLGCTIIPHGKDWLAIWQIDPSTPQDPVHLAANMVHEMFHAHQMRQREGRIPNDLQGLLSPDDLAFHHLRRLEAQALCDAFTADSLDDKRRCLDRLLSLRSGRKARYGSGVHYAFCIETVEGSAEYCCAKALQQLDASRFEAQVDAYRQAVLGPALLFDPRRFSYFFGALLLLLLDTLGISYDKAITGNGETIAEALLRTLPACEAPAGGLPPPPAELIAAYASTQQHKASLFAAQDALHPARVTGRFYLCGFDPMNLHWREGRMLHRRFAILENRETGARKLLQGPLVTEHPDVGNLQDISAYAIAP